MVVRSSPPHFLSLRRLKRQLPFSLFAIVLTAFLFFHTANPLRSQTPSPSPTDGCQVPQPLCQEIRQLAQDDVEAEIPRRTPHAIDQFKELHPDWKIAPSRVKLAIGKTYDTEYTQRSDANKKDPLKAFQKLFENGFAVLALVGIAGILGALLKDTIKQWLAALFTAIDNWIYARFAGISLVLLVPDRGCLWVDRPLQSPGLVSTVHPSPPPPLATSGSGRATHRWSVYLPLVVGANPPRTGAESAPGGSA